MVKRVAFASAVVAVLVAPVFSLFDASAGLHYAIGTGWMIANLLVWMAIITMALRPRTDTEPAPIFLLLLAIAGKLVLLFGGFIALRVFAPYTKWQLAGIVAGVSTVMLVAAFKAAGSRFAKPRQTVGKSGTEAHI